MRFIKDIPNDFCKAGLYSFNNKYVIRFEAGMYEQIYKVSELDISGEEEIEEIFKKEFLEKIANRFKEMDQDFESVLNSDY
jgi:hypothetical protein